MAARRGCAAIRVSRVIHSGGKSYVELVRMRAGTPLGAPDAVVFPASHEQVLAVLAACSAERVAVVPFGGGHEHRRRPGAHCRGPSTP